MVRKILSGIILVGLMFILFVGMGSAAMMNYGYGGSNYGNCWGYNCGNNNNNGYYGWSNSGYYEQSSSFSSKSSGGYGRPTQMSSTSYDKVTSWNYLRDGTKQKTTSYVKVERESPPVYSARYAYGGYMNMGNNYPNYNTRNMRGNYNYNSWNNGW